jgi:AA9 family protein
VLLQNNLTWHVRIPLDIAPGNYVLRHEMIALHAAGNKDGAQNYPFCFSLAISGDGSKNPDGVLATNLYKNDHPGILFDLFRKYSTYSIPGVS